MPCKRIVERLDAYLDGDLEAGEALALREHLSACDDCARTHASETQLREDLKRLPVAEPRPDFFATALAVATRRRRHGDRRGRSRWTFWSGAIAASLCVWLASALLGRIDAPSAHAPEVTIAVDTTRPVNLVFSAAHELTDARVSLELPTGLEVAGFEGRKEISWTTDLHEGKNVLRVPLIAHAPMTDLLVARLDHFSGTKTFRLKVRVI